jgi:hypothetical protein
LLIARGEEEHLARLDERFVLGADRVFRRFGQAIRETAIEAVLRAGAQVGAVAKGEEAVR